jgi:hypothetical protein
LESENELSVAHSVLLHCDDGIPLRTPASTVRQKPSATTARLSSGDRNRFVSITACFQGVLFALTRSAWRRLTGVSCRHPVHSGRRVTQTVGCQPPSADWLPCPGFEQPLQ